MHVILLSMHLKKERKKKRIANENENTNVPLYLVIPMQQDFILIFGFLCSIRLTRLILQLLIN